MTIIDEEMERVVAIAIARGLLIDPDAVDEHGIPAWRIAMHAARAALTTALPLIGERLAGMCDAFGSEWDGDGAGDGANYCANTIRSATQPERAISPASPA